MRSDIEASLPPVQHIIFNIFVLKRAFLLLQLLPKPLSDKKLLPVETQLIVPPGRLPVSLHGTHSPLSRCGASPPDTKTLVEIVRDLFVGSVGAPFSDETLTESEISRSLATHQESEALCNDKHTEGSHDWCGGQYCARSLRRSVQLAPGRGAAH